MAEKVVPYSRPVIDKLSIKLTKTYILALVKDVSRYLQTLIVKGQKQLSWELSTFACY